MNHRPLSRRHAATTIGRSSRALLAFAVTAGMAFQAGAHPVKAEEDVTVEGYLADLVGKASNTEKEVSSLQLELGGLRESANKARVDLGRAQSKAQKAQNDVVSARDRLKASDKEVTSAQGKLDDIARSAYTQGGDASPIPMAAGEDSASTALDRSTYIRMAAEKQRAEVNRLDLARTQNANQESGLRSNRDSANQALRTAVQAHKDAAAAMASSMSQLRGKQQLLQKLITQQKQAQAKLRAARSAVDTLANTKPNATSWEKRRVAEAAASGVVPADKAKDSQQDKNKSATKPKTPIGVDSYAGQATDTAETDSASSSSTPSSASGTATPSSDTTATSALATSSSPSTPTESGAPTETSAASPTETGGAPGQTEGPRAGAPSGSSPAGSSLSELPEIPNSFAESSAGDDQRQQAINSLLKAGESALMAGFGNYAQSGDRNAALQAGLNAGRDSAGKAYDEHMKRAQNAHNSAPATPSTATPATPTDTATTAPAAPSETAQQTAPSTTAPDTTNPAETSDPDTPQQPATPEVPQIPGITDGTIPGLNPGGTPGTAPGNADDSVDTSGTAQEKIERVIKRAETQMGVTYAWGGGNHHGPTLGIRDGGVADSFGDYAKVGFDCSGLMMYAFAAVGIHLEHYSGYQYTAGRQVPVSEAKRGDMLFWGPGGSQHVALYLGDNKMLEAPQSGDVVKVSDVRWAGIEPMAVRMIE
ncbi:DIP1281 family NlpC/P60 protein [uncultured Corynebacterium sp.]|uniref:DIP1281 family NlpC/P60 protein n=1 Tax=uncultured Corynebacterium sp. TaxID=159447 RepID=UPI0025CBB8A2|nr:NlpC/P60 family protein [uncultured Corynebacterium sp.]